jgi:two-component system NtrC family sensor kinase
MHRIRHSSLRGRLSGLALSALSPTLARRLKALVTAARRLARGDLGARAGLPHGDDEVGELARALDAMARDLEQVTRRYELLLAAAGEGIYGVDRAGRTTFVNPAAARMLGWEPAELVGRPMHEVLFPPGPGSSPDCPLTATLRDGATIAGTDGVLTRKDGSPLPVEYVSTAIRERGEIVGAAVVFRDVTERWQAEAEIERQRVALLQREKLATMGSLLAGIAHELTNPLTVIVGQTGLLREEVRGGPLVERVERIAQAGEQCLRTVRTFLALARQRAPERAAVDLNRVVRESIDLLAHQIHAYEVATVLDLGDPLPLLWAEPHQLNQVAINLVANALHALREQPPPRRLSLSTRARSPEGPVTLEVADTGPGIAPEVLPRIFEPFFTTKPPGEGTGLGLPLCLHIVEAHGGVIHVESAPARGTVVRVELPVHAPAAKRGEAASSPWTNPPAAGYTTLRRQQDSSGL